MKILGLILALNFYSGKFCHEIQFDDQKLLQSSLYMIDYILQSIFCVRIAAERMGSEVYGQIVQNYVFGSEFEVVSSVIIPSSNTVYQMVGLNCLGFALDSKIINNLNQI